MRRQATGLPGEDSVSVQEGAGQLVGGQSSVTEGGVPKYTGLQRKSPRMNTMLLLG